jgi:hypothetical protein
MTDIIFTGTLNDLGSFGVDRIMLTAILDKAEVDRVEDEGLKLLYPPDAPGVVPRKVEVIIRTLD